MDKSVEEFFTKNADQGYIDQYEKDHGPRLDWMLKEFNLKDIKNKRVLDVGGGLGFLGKRLDLSNEYWIFDGAEYPGEKKMCTMIYRRVDLDYDKFADDHTHYAVKNSFDYGFCLETLEHLTNPYNCLAEIKKLVKENGEVIISIPHVNVTHNYIYPALMVDPNNFAQFLAQMAFPVTEYKLWDKGWNAHHFRCRNAPWTEAKMLFPKQESKFHGKTPVEYVNL